MIKGAKMNDFIEIPVNKRSISQRSIIFGIATNDANYITKQTINGKKITCPFYRKWMNMLSRCYCDKYQAKQGTYIGCAVAIEWHSFSVFKSWMEEQDWEGKHLDKDILIEGNKVYSPENCVFVTRAINNLLNDNKSRRGAYPLGVCFNARANKFQAEIRINGKAKYLGCFSSPEKAGEAYLKSKAALIRKVAEEQAPRLKNGLLRHAESLHSLV